MNDPLRSFSLPVLLLLSTGPAAAVRLPEPRPSAEADAELVIVPFTPAEVRVLGTVETAVCVYANVEFDRELELVEFTIRCEGDVIQRQALDQKLVGDPRFGRLNALAERLPRSLRESNRERRYFADERAPEFVGDEAREWRRELLTRWEGLSREYAAGRALPCAQLDFPLHTDQIFFPEEPAGTTRELSLRVSYRLSNGALRSASTVCRITRLAAPLALPSTLAAAGATLHSGDLHVHSCHGEAVGACPPSTDCAAEALQLLGSFSYAQLRSQYEALGMDWFTATDHSYCINSSAEFAAIQAECAAATDAGFLCLADIEVSSDEVGVQHGTDLADALCGALFATPSNHMGSHQINARIEGGQDSALGFCDRLGVNALTAFTSNVFQTRFQGGYPIVHHPSADSFAWNSEFATRGIAAAGMHGVEIWNGPTQLGQGGHVGRWVSWLLAGELLYAYAGSDTHDQAFAFGANHVILDGQSFDAQNLHAALRAGHHYISSGPVLVMEADLGSGVIPMGTLQPVAQGSPPSNYTPRVVYNFGTQPGNILIYTGRVGDAAETLLCQSGPLTGQGTFRCPQPAPLETEMNSWVRAYAQSGIETAFTNPIFFLSVPPGCLVPTRYCDSSPNSVGPGARISWTGTPSPADDTLHLLATDAPANQPLWFYYGEARGSTPFGNGLRCVQAGGARLFRFPSLQTDAAGTADMKLDFAQAPAGAGGPGAWSPGDTWYCQALYRDPADGSGAFNLTDALEVQVRPGTLHREMKAIPGGSFEMGLHVGSGLPEELPVHPVTLDAFRISTYEVTHQQYVDFLNSAHARGRVKLYLGSVYLTEGSGALLCKTTLSSIYSSITWNGLSFCTKAGREEHPMTEVSWFGAAAYANGRSRDEGRRPCYDEQTWDCDFNNDGFRLPTEAEWEYAARGGLHNPYFRYPWGDTIDGSMANFWPSGDPFETGPIPRTTPVGYYDGNQLPAGIDMANGYGLYDMIGNIEEWCNDRYNPSYYSASPVDNPHGPPNAPNRVLRGGSWGNSALDWPWKPRSASRGPWAPATPFYLIGFRVVTSQP